MTTATMRAFLVSDCGPLQSLLDKFTYRPDWHFRIEHGCLVVDTLVMNTDNFDEKIRVTFTHGIPDQGAVRSDFPWQEWLFQQIRLIEDHETCEFFKINGVKVYDPHA